MAPSSPKFGRRAGRSERIASDEFPPAIVAAPASSLSSRFRSENASDRDDSAKGDGGRGDAANAAGGGGDGEVEEDDILDLVGDFAEDSIGDASGGSPPRTGPRDGADDAENGVAAFDTGERRSLLGELSPDRPGALRNAGAGCESVIASTLPPHTSSSASYSSALPLGPMETARSRTSDSSTSNSGTFPSKGDDWDSTVKQEEAEELRRLQRQRAHGGDAGGTAASALPRGIPTDLSSDFTDSRNTRDYVSTADARAGRSVDTGGGYNGLDRGTAAPSSAMSSQGLSSSGAAGPVAHRIYDINEAAQESAEGPAGSGAAASSAYLASTADSVTAQVAGDPGDAPGGPKVAFFGKHDDGFLRGRRDEGSAAAADSEAPFPRARVKKVPSPGRGKGRGDGGTLRSDSASYSYSYSYSYSSDSRDGRSSTASGSPRGGGASPRLPASGSRPQRKSPRGANPKKKSPRGRGGAFSTTTTSTTTTTTATAGAKKGSRSGKRVVPPPPPKSSRIRTRPAVPPPPPPAKGRGHANAKPGELAAKRITAGTSAGTPATFSSSSALASSSASAESDAAGVRRTHSASHGVGLKKRDLPASPALRSGSTSNIAALAAAGRSPKRSVTGTAPGRAGRGQSVEIYAAASERAMRAQLYAERVRRQNEEKRGTADDGRGAARERGRDRTRKRPQTAPGARAGTRAGAGARPASARTRPKKVESKGTLGPTHAEALRAAALAHDVVAKAEETSLVALLARNESAFSTDDAAWDPAHLLGRSVDIVADAVEALRMDGIEPLVKRTRRAEALARRLSRGLRDERRAARGLPPLRSREDKENADAHASATSSSGLSSAAASRDLASSASTSASASSAASAASGSGHRGGRGRRGRGENAAGRGGAHKTTELLRQADKVARATAHLRQRCRALEKSRRSVQRKLDAARRAATAAPLDFVAQLDGGGGAERATADDGFVCPLVAARSLQTTLHVTGVRADRIADAGETLCLALAAFERDVLAASRLPHSALRAVTSMSVRPRGADAAGASDKAAAGSGQSRAGRKRHSARGARYSHFGSSRAAARAAGPIAGETWDGAARLGQRRDIDWVHGSVVEDLLAAMEITHVGEYSISPADAKTNAKAEPGEADTNASDVRPGSGAATAGSQEAQKRPPGSKVGPKTATLNTLHCARITIASIKASAATFDAWVDEKRAIDTERRAAEREREREEAKREEDRIEARREAEGRFRRWLSDKERKRREGNGGGAESAGGGDGDGDGDGGGGGGGGGGKSLGHPNANETAEQRRERREEAAASFRHWLEKKEEARRLQLAEERRRAAVAAEAQMDRSGARPGAGEAHADWIRRKEAQKESEKARRMERAAARRKEREEKERNERRARGQGGAGDKKKKKIPYSKWKRLKDGEAEAEALRRELENAKSALEADEIEAERKIKAAKLAIRGRLPGWMLREADIDADCIREAVFEMQRETRGRR